MKIKRKTDPFILWMDVVGYSFVLIIAYACYGVVAPLFFGDPHVEWVSCPVTQAFTIVEDGDSEKNGRRVIQAKCDVPELVHVLGSRLSEKFDQIANDYRGLRKGDAITCVAKWPTAASFPLQYWKDGQQFAPHIEWNTCRPPRRLWLK